MFTVAFIYHESHSKHLNFPLHGSWDHRPPCGAACSNLKFGGESWIVWRSTLFLVPKKYTYVSSDPALIAFGRQQLPLPRWRQSIWTSTRNSCVYTGNIHGSFYVAYCHDNLKVVNDIFGHFVAQFYTSTATLLEAAADVATLTYLIIDASRLAINSSKSQWVGDFPPWVNC